MIKLSKRMTINKQCTLSVIAASILLSFSSGVWAEENDSEFESAFLRKDKNGASPDIFLYKNAIAPGMKRVEVVVNDRITDVYEVNFVPQSQGRQVVPCLNRRLLNDAGVKTELYDNWRTSLKNKEAPSEASAVCDDLEQRIPAARVFYDDAHQQLRLTLPQEAVNSQRFQMISPKEWDDGTPTLRTAYNGYFYHSRQKNSGSDGGRNINNSAFVSLNSTASFGAWRVYSFDTFNKNPDRGWQSNHDRLYAERNIVSLSSKISAGDIYTYTPSNIMGVIPLRGFTLGTNERMLLESQFTYAPVIRGTARTNARLIVRQRGNIIYSSTLTPGPFAIDDMYSGQIGTDLDVMVEETDGTEQKFTVPYTSLPNMIRPGAMRYSLSVGEYRNNNQSETPIMGALSLERGFEAFTLNAAGLGADDYQSVAAGVAWNVGNVGAFSLDVAQARYTYDEVSNLYDKETKNGTAVRLLYAKQFDNTDTGLRILGYQYRSEHFLSFSEFNSRNHHRKDGYDNEYEDGDSLWNKRRRSRLEVNVNQGMQEYGSLYLTLSQDRYYGTSEKTISASAGYGFMAGPASVSLAYTYNKNGKGDNDNSLNLGVSIPLRWGERDRNYNSVNYNLTRNKDNRYSQSVGLSGSSQNSPLSYSLNVQKDYKDKFSESASLGYNSNLVTLNGSVSHSNYSDQFSAGMSGGLVLYKGGAILAPRMGDTIAIIETPGASNIGVSGSTNKTDYFGRAIVNYLSPYRYNTVGLDTTDAPTVELKESSRKVVPTEGAAVLLRFSTRVGRRAMVIIQEPHSVPVGAIVTAEGQDEEVGIVGNGGLAYLTGMDARRDETLTVSWGKDMQCKFTLPKLPEGDTESQWHTKIPVDCL
ncbi:fimbrial biogenesis outer membrane usher protein [Budviciaceae bacterium BWR-B9]|uniref:Fimbrial biogenesis outer membrane usher protein n=1 Tax=Limnobaculum allomyrinae TaxID=2791986 RepID=A0ABS1IVM2_9GAMM|nr:MULTISPECIES: fimbria/pilus outer membrane usher protein [Limnobaculum]MBK5145591.1 fimbrial biogenesis outer membrane usher protein [Limnobaculum allomyrinae]MBV7693710.1 fimbrial biogenesis outer membrane usher protein [Limnobaculum sp. M2-1]